jgi:hypothetical protein
MSTSLIKALLLWFQVRFGLPDSTKQQVMEILLYFVCQNCTDMQFFTLQVFKKKDLFKDMHPNS